MADADAKMVGSIEELLEEVRRDFCAWNTDTFPWFRGEKQRTKTPLLPVLFREPGRHDENVLLQRFRMKAPSLGLQVIPPRDHTDEWLFLARHVGLPTRLLDWTEGLLIALLFAVYDAHGEPRKNEDGATVWMLDPVALNGLTAPRPTHSNAFPLPWINAPTELPSREEVLSWLIASADDTIATGAGYSNTAEYLTAIRASMLSNIGALNVRRAWTQSKGSSAGKDGTDLPVAIYGTSIHPRISAQKGCFTIHGIREEPLSQLGVDTRILRQYQIASAALDQMRVDLRMAGITYSTVFPDLDGLAMDLRAWF